MKKLLFTASLVSLVFLSRPILAVEEHHPQTGEKTPAQEMQDDTNKMDTTVKKMQEMREKLKTEQDPAARRELMRQHMQMMQEGMQMMGMMGGGAMAMEEHTAKTDQKTHEHGESEGHMMSGGMMKGGMMGADKDMGNRMERMEKQMMMMQEIMNGMMTQHQLTDKQQ